MAVSSPSSTLHPPSDGLGDGCMLQMLSLMDAGHLETRFREFSVEYAMLKCEPGSIPSIILIIPGRIWIQM